MSTKDETRRPSIGVATVVVDKQGRVLVGKDTRKGNAVYGVPGGHWESGETLKDCAIREVREESGVTCSTVQLISVYDFYRADKEKSYVSIGMKALYVAGELTSKEDEGRLEWGWYTVDEALNLNLFPPDKILLERYKSGVIYE